MAQRARRLRMSIARHLGVFAFDMAGPSAYTSGSAGWMFGNQPDSISRYFNDCSGGAIALTAEVFNVTPNAREAAAILQMPLDRLPRLENCVNAVRAAGYTDLRRFDALVFCVFGGVCDT